MREATRQRWELVAKMSEVQRCSIMIGRPLTMIVKQGLSYRITYKVHWHSSSREAQRQPPVLVLQENSFTVSGTGMRHGAGDTRTRNEII